MQVTQERRHLSRSHNGASVVELDQSVNLTMARYVHCIAAAVAMDVAAAAAMLRMEKVDKAACSSASSQAGCR